MSFVVLAAAGRSGWNHLEEIKTYPVRILCADLGPGGKRSRLDPFLEGPHLRSRKWAPAQPNFFCARTEVSSGPFEKRLARAKPMSGDAMRWRENRPRDFRKVHFAILRHPVMTALTYYRGGIAA